MTSPARDQLRAALAALAETAAAAEAAHAAAKAGEDFVAELLAEVGQFDRVDAQIAAARADVIKAALVCGGRPDLTISAELAAAANAKREAENRLAAARQALAVLVDEAATAGRAERDARAAVDRARRDVVTEEVAVLAAEFRDLDKRSSAVFARLFAAAGAWLPNGTAAPTLFPVGRDVLALLHQPARGDSAESVNTPTQLAVRAAAESLRAFVAVLAENPDAAWT